ncbi:4Fe-4S binding protein [Halodesulfurarchaeum sp.]|uniref:4Fe-4S binding protein n=1 Tax=Halodesulfurarchaeum sp. TaxID=1980530 RepID=UPI001BBEDCE3|nr:4Fe-4S binding protein [Halodesulfurarchaeum sp.]
MTIAIISDCRGTANIDREAVADSLTVDETVVTGSIADHQEEIVDRIEAAGTDRVVFVAGTGPAVAELQAGLREAGYLTDRVSPFIGAAQDDATATAIVAGSANAALGGMAAQRDFPADPEPSPEHVLVVGDPLAARDLAGTTDVTLLTNGTDLHDTSLPEAVMIRSGAAVTLERNNGGYEVTVERRVTDDCTECGRCLRRYPEATTSVPVQVTGEAVQPAVCPANAIRPADDPAVETVQATQVVWPEYSGPLLEDRWVHGIRTGVTGAVRRAARMRARPEVTVDHGTCAVGTAGNEGCSLCESACPNDAISISLTHGGGVSVEPDRCVACGTCVSVCPTASIEPTRVYDAETTATVVDAAMEPMAEATGGSRFPWGADSTPFGVAFVSEEIAPAFRATLSSRAVPAILPIEVPNVLSVPDVATIYTIARGADGVILASDPDRATEPVEDAAREANQALSDLGLGERVRVTDTTDPDALAAAMDGVLGEFIDVVSTAGIETDTRHALGLGASVSLAAGPGTSSESVAVPGSGSVTVDEAGCTLCSTCHDVCPTEALEQTDDTLYFDPGACVGCGHCETACPEDVMTVSGTVAIGDGTIPDRRPIVEKEMVECKVCGEPFASKDGLDTMREQLDESALETLDLEICPSCRTDRTAQMEYMSSE